jgi:hypothetical protein
MIHHDDDVPVADLLARLGEGDARELFRRLLETALQELIDAELAGAIGARPHDAPLATGSSPARGRVDRGVGVRRRQTLMSLMTCLMRV